MSNLTAQQAMSNLLVLHRKVKMVPDEHEAVIESLAVLNDLISPTITNRKFNINVKTAFDNMVAVYNRALFSVEEFEAMKESLGIFAKLVNNSDNSVTEKPKLTETSGKGKN